MEIVFSVPMMKYVILFIHAIATCSSTDWRELTEYLRLYYGVSTAFMRCSTSDPNVDNCMLKAALFSVNKTFNGLPNFKLPPLEPMKLGDRVLTAGSGPASLEIDLKNAVLSGVSKVRFDSARYRKESHCLEFNGFHKIIKMTARYSMKGKLLYVPINSEGTAVLTFNSVLANHSFQFTPRHGKQSLLSKPKQKTVVRMIPVLKSLSLMQIDVTPNNMGAVASRFLNNLLNSNWRTLYDSFKPSIEKWLEEVYTNTMDSFFSSFNYDQMFPNRLRL